MALSSLLFTMAACRSVAKLRRGAVVTRAVTMQFNWPHGAGGCFPAPCMLIVCCLTRVVVAATGVVAVGIEGGRMF